MIFSIYLPVIFYFINAVYSQVSTIEEDVDAKVVKCEVCKATIQEMENEVSSIDPEKKIDVGGFRIDATGNTISKSVQLSKSEMYLTELMERICKKLEDYAKVKHKKTGKVGITKMMIGNSMNPDLALYDFIQDGDLNKSLEHYCLEILDEFDEIFVDQFMQEVLPTDLDYKICTEKAKLCNDLPEQEDYKFEDEL